MKTIRMLIFDNNGESYDRYTIIFMDEPDYAPGSFSCVIMSENPNSELGFCQHGTSTVGDHLGKLIKFKELPESCQKALKRILD